MGGLDLDAFKAKVLAEGAACYRDLPWRNTRDPYAVLLSEVMLQQTQVARVDGRWQRWLEMFPTPEVLAAAPLSAVLAEWQGMGYNRRAVNLQRCAQAIVSEHDGVVPQDFDALLALPGVGPATAAGVRAFAFDEPGVYLETNVRTVFLHELFAGQDSVTDAALKPLVKATCPQAGHVREWYYALLDYGAYLKSVLPNPSRRSKHHSVQSKFEGSHRQKRAYVLRRLLEAPADAGQLLEDLNAFEASAEREAVAIDDVEQILAELACEGFIEVSGAVWQCKE